jgi:hypothetical protein
MPKHIKINTLRDTTPSDIRQVLDQFDHSLISFDHI